MRTRSPLAVILSLFLLMPFLGTIQPEPAEASDEIVIGILTELSGFMAPAGIPGMKGVRTAIEVAGSKVAGKPIRVVVEDTGTNPAKAMDKVRKLVEIDKACFIMGPLWAETHLAIAPYLDKVKVPSLTLEANWETMALNNHWTWITNGGLIQNTYPLGIMAHDDLGYKKASAIYPEVAGGPDFYEGFRRGFTERGGTVIQEQVFAPETQDFIPYLINVKKEADVVYEFAVGAFIFPFYKAVRELGFKIPTIEGPGEFPNPEVLKAVGDILVGRRFVTSYFYTLDTPGNKVFVEAYKKRWGELPAHVSGCGYSAGQIALEALKLTGGNTSGEALAKALGGISMDTVRGHITLTPDRVGTLDYSAGEVVKVEGEYTYKYLKTYSVKMSRVGDKLEYSLVKVK